MRTGINNRDIVRDDVSVNRKRLLTNDTPFATKEAYVKLRTSLMFCMTSDKTRPCKVFAVTSAKPSEGKSITASNIAISYAMLGKKTILIDADVRKPTMRKLWNISSNVGLCDFIARIKPLELISVLRRARLFHHVFIRHRRKPVLALAYAFPLDTLFAFTL